MASTRFAVVEFEEDESVELVLTKWLNKAGTCVRFPSKYMKQNAYERLILAGTPAEPSWAKYTVKVIEYSRTYQDAAARVKILLETTQSFRVENTDNEENKRKRIEGEDQLEESQLIFSDEGDEDDNRLPSPKKIKFPTMTSTPIEASSHLQPPVNEGDIKSFRKEISGILYGLQRTVADLANEVRELKYKMEDINNRTETNESPDIALLQKLPLKTEEEFQELEGLLNNDTKLTSLLTNILAAVGGRDSRTMTYSCMKRVITSELAQKFSFTGRPPKVKDAIQKRKFGSSNLNKCVMAAVRKCYSSQKESETQMNISSWLQQAKRRLQIRSQESLDNEENVNTV